MTDKAMDTRRNKRSTNKLLKLMSNIVFTIFMLIMVFLILITGQSRFTGQEPSLLGYRMYIVDSGSMMPTLPVNSLIIIKETPAEEIIEDDIVTYTVGNENIKVTHRIVQVLENQQGFITRGDANNTEDPNVLLGDRIIGKLVYSIPYIGIVLRGLGTKVGIIILLTLGLLVILVPVITERLFKREE